MEPALFNQILLFGALQGLILALVVWKKSDSNKNAVFFLACLLVLTSVILVGRMFYETEVLKQFWMVYTYADVIIFLFGPIIFLFTYSMLHKESWRQIKFYKHFIPVLCHLFIFNTFVSLVYFGVLDNTFGKHLWWLYLMIEFLAIISLGYYSWQSLLLFRRFEKDYYSSYSFPALSAFLKSFLYFFSILAVIWCVAFLLRAFTIIPDNAAIGYYGFWTMAAISTYFLSYKILLNPEVLSVNQLALFQNEDKTENIKVQSEATVSPGKKRLEQLIHRTEIFRNPKLSLSELAETMDVSRHELSRIINQGFGKTFFDLINSYRIRAFVKTYQADENLTFLEVAYEVGFNSKSAFNRAFRKEFSCSPSEYFKNQSTLTVEKPIK